MSPSARRLSAVAAGTAVASVPVPVGAHAIGQVFALPVPLWLYLVGAASAVAASFVVLAVVQRRPAAAARYPTRRVPPGVARGVSVALAATGMAWWYGAILAGLTTGDISPLPGVLAWVGIWTALPIFAALFGNPWPSLSPFRTTFAILESIGRGVGLRRLDAGLAYPPWLGRWPAVVLLFIGVWMELVLPGVTVASNVALTLLTYTLVTMIGIGLFGRTAWLTNAELFEVLLGWFGRIGPVGRRTVDAEVCAGCSQACDPRRCIDCHECVARAEPGEQAVELRPWVAGLTEVRSLGWADAAFVVLALAAVSYDGLIETAGGGMLLDVLLPASIAVLGPSAAAFVLAETGGLAVTYGAFLAAFAIVVLLTRALVAAPAPARLGGAMGTYAATLLPIAAGYVLAHYFTLVLQGLVWLPGLLADPNWALAPVLDFPPIAAIWYFSVAAIVGGHIAAVALGHRLLLRDAPRRAVTSGLPLLALMVGYTILSLWIIAQPIVIEPNTVPAAQLAP